MRSNVSSDRLTFPLLAGQNVLVGDIGGTNARLQVWAVTSETQSELLFEKVRCAAGALASSAPS